MSRNTIAKLLAVAMAVADAMYVNSFFDGSMEVQTVESRYDQISVAHEFRDEFWYLAFSEAKSEMVECVLCLKERT